MSSGNKLARANSCIRFGASKSSLGWYLTKLFIEAGGIVNFIDTENKTNPDQVKAIVQNDKLLRENVIFESADSLDTLMDKLISKCQEYNEIVPDKNIPMMLFVDSLNAVTSDDAAEKRLAGEDMSNMGGARNAGKIQNDINLGVANQ